MSGEQVFHVLRSLNPNIPVLLVSGYSEHDVMERFVNTGLTGFIQKPFTKDSLLQQIKPHLQSATPGITPMEIAQTEYSHSRH
jgi:two-component system cell cycle sensor histidine kinase/response regulator CckA